MTLTRGDCLVVMREMEAASVDSIVTDPPYGLTANKKGGSGLKSMNTDSPAGRSRVTTGGGFMGLAWDRCIPPVDIWRECLRVLKPGGHLLSFAGTRTQHRMACAIEDAGFEIRDMIAWIYGSGFPKSLDVSKAIDKRGGQSVANWELGFNLPTPDQFNAIRDRYTLPFADLIEAEREVVGLHHSNMGGLGGERLGSVGGDITAPATDAARQWNGWGTALKPSFEPITVARKPLVGTVAENVLAHGTGGLNVDGCRIEGIKPSMHPIESDRRNHPIFATKSRTGHGTMFTEGRWPANFVHDGSEEVLELFPSSKDGVAVGRNASAGGTVYGNGHGLMSQEKGDASFGYGSEGSAARFFYCAKASREDRDEGLEEFGDQILARSCQAAAEAGRGNTVEKSRGAFNKARIVRNHHATVKPTDLMRWLCRLVTPPGGIILDPFMGSGSTGKAAKLEGFEFHGIEIDEDYFRIAVARIGKASVDHAGGPLFAQFAVEPVVQDELF